MSDNGLTSREYYAEITSIAQECLREATENGSEVCERVHETVDGHQWIMYNRYHVEILGISSNQDAYFDNYGKLEADDYSTAMQQMAYAAMETDVQEAISEQEDRMLRTYTVFLHNVAWKDAAVDSLPTEETFVIEGEETEYGANETAVARFEEQVGGVIEDFDADSTLKITFPQD